MPPGEVMERPSTNATALSTTVVSILSAELIPPDETSNDARTRAKSCSKI